VDTCIRLGAFAFSRDEPVTEERVKRKLTAILSVLFTDSHSESARTLAQKEGLHLVSTLAYAEICAVIARFQRERVLAVADRYYGASSKWPRGVSTNGQFSSFHLLSQEWILPA
jgi:hypothetical protein